MIEILTNGIRYFVRRTTHVSALRKKWVLFGPTVETVTEQREVLYLRLMGYDDGGGPYQFGVQRGDALGVGFPSEEEARKAAAAAKMLERAQSAEVSVVEGGHD